jgi:uncharacterized protein YcgL (UPF0745 family)
MTTGLHERLAAAGHTYILADDLDDRDVRPQILTDCVGAPQDTMVLVLDRTLIPHEW